MALVDRAFVIPSEYASPGSDREISYYFLRLQ